jgi:predicted transcriptional regulator
VTITSARQCQELSHRADMAEENMSSSRFGEHARLMEILRREHGIRVRDRREAIKVARRLCDEFLFANEYEGEK